MYRLWKIGGGGLLIGAAAFVLLPQLNKGEIFIAGDKPVTSEQVREKLESNGWSDIEVTRKGRYIVAFALKNGQKDKIQVDSQTGRLRVLDDDDDGGDGDDD
jgi:hypothetical protein